MIIPEKVKMMAPAVTCALIAPSSATCDQASVLRALERLRSYGWAVENISATQRQFQRFAGTDAQRAADLNQFVDAANPLPDIVLAIRGGYGATRLLPLIDYEGLKRRLAGTSTLWVGHSDFTAIQMALLAKAGLTTFSGPMLCTHFGAETVNEFTLRQFQTIRNAPEMTLCSMQTQLPSYAIDVNVNMNMNMNMNVNGILWGGNLAIICSLVGTPYLPQIDGGILFIEDVNEHPFRIERMLYQLHAAGVLARQHALICGGFTDFKSAKNDNGYTLAAMLEQMRSIIGIPIFTGLPFGHCADLATLPVGARAQLIADTDGWRLRMYGYPFKNKNK